MNGTTMTMRCRPFVNVKGKASARIHYLEGTTGQEARTNLVRKIAEHFRDSLTTARA